jgi:hypothetical protein
MGPAVLATVPNPLFLVILFFVTRYILRMIQVFFRSIDRGVATRLTRHFKISTPVPFPR